MRTSWTRWAFVACMAWPAATTVARSEEHAKPADEAVAERGPFEVVLELKGAFEPLAAAVIDGRPESFTAPLEIVRVVPHGTRVAEGNVILELAAERIERVIAEAEIAVAAGEKALEVARRELAAAEAAAPLDLTDAERQDRVAKEDLARFTDAGRKVAEDEARFNVRGAEQRLRSEREELAQLEKMYRDKDLTEETEEMILQRTRFDVEAAEQFLTRNRFATEDALERDLPRRAVELERGAKRAALALTTLRATQALQLEQKRLGVAKLEHERQQAIRKLEDLRHDLGLATVKAPSAGTVYHGRLHDGAWTTATVAGKAIVGQAVPLGELSFTVVGDGPVRFRAKVEEKDLHLVAPGLAGRVAPTGYPAAEAAVTLEPGFAPVPRDGKCDAAFTVTAPAGAQPILPAMTGTARFVVRSRPDAITVPEAAVSRAADGGRVVHVVRDGAAPEKRAVRVGLTSGGRTEILEGLAAGDRVRTTKP